MAKLVPRMGHLLPFPDPVPLIGGLPLGNLPSSSPLDSYPGLCQSPFLDSRLVSMPNLRGLSPLSLLSNWVHVEGGNLRLLGAAVATLLPASLYPLVCGPSLAWGHWAVCLGWGVASLPPVTLCPCAPGSAGASLAQNPVSQTVPGQARGAPRPPPLLLPPRRVKATGSPITNGVFSAGRRTRSWANSPPSRLCCMPTLTSPISSKITQVPVGGGQWRQQPGKMASAGVTCHVS